LTDGWKVLTTDQIISGLRSNTETALSIINEAATSNLDLEVLVFGLYLHMMAKLRAMEKEKGLGTPLSGEVLAPDFSRMTVPSGLANIDAEIRGWMLQRYETLLRLGGA